MKKTLLLLVVFLALSINSYSQFVFEKAYFVNNSNERVECLIKDLDWKNNPRKFEYKLSENTDIQTETILNVQEFGFSNGAKYVRVTAEIDHSTDEVKNLGPERNPIFKTETVFLKSIIEGKASLFYYRDDLLKRFFYKKDDAAITQLVYKRYRKDGDIISRNTYFKQQLLNDLKCDAMNESEFESLKYELNSLEKIITEYNQCQNSTSQKFKQEVKRDLFNLAIRPGIDFSSLKISSGVSEIKNVSFDKQTNFRIGVEFEYIPFYHKNNWSIIVEPTYQSYSGNKTYEVKGVNQGTLNAVLEYRSIEVPMGIRYSTHLSKSSKVFLNAQYILDFNLEASLNYYRADGSEFDKLDINAGKSFALGAGFKFRDKYIVEFRINTSRQILDRYINWNSNYNKSTIIIGYNFM